MLLNDLSTLIVIELTSNRGMLNVSLPTLIACEAT